MTKKVLVVDDEIHIATTLEYMMKYQGYELAVVHNGQDALDKAASFKPDLVLLDVMMPNVNGFEVCRRIRENADLAHTKIIMLSARGRGVEIEKGMTMGADDYITKPFSAPDLIDKAKTLLGE